MDDDDWDDLDDYAIEQCVLKENEVLSQNPDLQHKNFTQHANVSKESKDHWVNGQFNSFIDGKFNVSKTESSNLAKGNHFNRSNSCGSFSKPFATAPKKQSAYKPLIIGPSSSSFNPNIAFIKEEKYECETDLQSLQKQIEQIRKEKLKLEEENFVKQGEVHNLRCELKRKETSLETERVDQCIALEAAEKRGKDKTAKTIADLELKVKSLEREVDRLEGNILFKNREVDELLVKCKQFENQASTSVFNGSRATHFSPSPKKRKLADRFSPNKSSFNFADKFDFGDKKKVVKSVEVQTESETKEQTRVSINISSARGRISVSRKAFYLLNNSKYVKKCSSGLTNWNGCESYLGHMISSQGDGLQSNTDSSEHLLVKHACTSLENLLKATRNENSCAERLVSGYNKNEENVFLTSSIPLVKILSVAKAGNEAVAQDAVRILALSMDYFLKDNVKNVTGVVSSLESLSFVIRQCSDFPPDLCKAVVETLKSCCDLCSTDDVVHQLISSLNSLSNFENFRRKICVNITGQCLLKKICILLKNTKMQTKLEVICNDLSVFVSRVLRDDTNTFVANSACNCSSLLLSVFVKNLNNTSRLTSKDLQWQCVLNGLKVLHTWQKKDTTWLEKTTQLNSYSLLLSTVIRKAKFLRAKRILDQHTWELLYDIYEIEESS